MGVSPLAPTDALIAAITIEGAIFVAFSLAYALAQPDTERGRHPFFAKAWFGWLVVLVMTGVAASATADWHLLYSRQNLDGATKQLQAYGLLGGIVAQPVIAAIINWASR